MRRPYRWMTCHSENNVSFRNDVADDGAFGGVVYDDGLAGVADAFETRATHSRGCSQRWERLTWWGMGFLEKCLTRNASPVQ